MVKIKCSAPNCRAEFNVKEEHVDKTLKEMMCPVCGEIFTNPFYDENESIDY